jgi:hypothetical protein
VSDSGGRRGNENPCPAAANTTEEGRQAFAELGKKITKSRHVVACPTSGLNTIEMAGT